MARAPLRAVVPPALPPLYFMQAVRRPMQSKAVWRLPLEGDPQQLLYVTDAPQRLFGFFFEDAIQSGPDTGQANTALRTDVRH